MTVFSIMNHEDYYNPVTNHWIVTNNNKKENIRKQLAFAANGLLIAKYGFILIEC